MVSTNFVASLARNILYYYTCIQFPKRSTKYNYLHKNNSPLAKYIISTLEFEDHWEMYESVLYLASGRCVNLRPTLC